MFPVEKNPQMRSPALYFCLWSVNLHEVLLTITDIAENLHKIFFFLLISKASSSQVFSLGFRVSWQS